MAKQIDTRAVGAVTKHAVKLERERRKTIAMQENRLLLRQALASPLVQIIGGITITEAAQSLGILNSKWAGGIEGSIVTMVGLQALKDYGIIGAGAMGFGFSAGSLISDILDEDNYIKKQAKMGLTQTTGLDAALASLGL